MLRVVSKYSILETVSKSVRACSSSVTTSSSTSPKRVEGTLYEVAPRPKDELVFDQRTHTGQAFDQDDYRLVRFTESSKQVNPNFAINLIAEEPPRPSKGRVTSCDGGGGALGHPKVFINLDVPGTHACGYCGLRFYLDDGAHEHGVERIQV